MSLRADLMENLRQLESHDYTEAAKAIKEYMAQVDRLVSYVEQTTPYVQATIGVGCTFDSTVRPGWVEIHDGRRRSSENQLQGILDHVKKLKE